MMQKNNNPILSIVTPSYNQERFIDETIKSVISQEGDFNIDYIIVDGKSTDGSVEIIKKYDTLLKQGKWPVKCKGINYRWVSEPDDGQSDAIAKGFRMAEGDVLAWLNSDDVYIGGALQKVVNFFRSHTDAVFVYGNTYFIDEDGKVIGEAVAEPFDLIKMAVRTLFSQQSTFIKKGAFIDSGGLDTSLRYVMDYDLWVRMAKKYKLDYMPEFLALFRLQEKSKTVSSQEACAFSREYLMNIRKHYDWAPLNRVYGYCYSLAKDRLPKAVSGVAPLVVIVALLITVVNYARLNKGLRLEDVKMINPRNFRKLFKDWSEIIMGG
jgi:glycosyltransferase involved in cell wall biosynthesis